MSPYLSPCPPLSVPVSMWTCNSLCIDSGSVTPEVGSPLGRLVAESPSLALSGEPDPSAQGWLPGAAVPQLLACGCFSLIYAWGFPECSEWVRLWLLLVLIYGGGGISTDSKPGVVSHACSPMPGKLSQEDHCEFKTSPERTCLKIIIMLGCASSFRHPFRSVKSQLKQTSGCWDQKL